ncbi:UNVERIFIED_CONTAM: Eukaryotic translation initiation factor 3 subunit D [Sesamum radiatum]|uniref:Eukaryotic translation initiation factor 3 subunit D n=1 Tax=Sesamum radiatum TaxID=300843 RepID=A0AAW2K421_SESRA
MVGFEVGAVPFNPDGWGPPDSSNAPLSIPNQPSNVPYAPFSRSEKLGRIADWTRNLSNQGRPGSKQGGHHPADSAFDFSGDDSFATLAADEDSSFRLVDTSAKSHHYNPNRPKFNPRWRFNAHQRSQLPQRRDEEVEARKREAEKERARRDRLYNLNRSQMPQRRESSVFKSSVDIQPEWNMLDQIPFSTFSKLSFSVPEPEDMLICGGLEFYDRSYDRITPKNCRPLERFKSRNFFKVTTTDDPVIRRLANEDKATVFATDTILSTLMCAPSVLGISSSLIREMGHSWICFLYTRHPRSPCLMKDDINSIHSLSVEAAYINQNFSQQVLIRDGNKVAFEEPNPFANEGEEVASVAYRYRRWKLDDDMYLVSRCEVQSVVDINNQRSFLTLNALNEFDPKYSGVDWEQKLETQRGAVLATELKNNANKLAKWTAQALLAGADMMKLGYVSRVHPRDHFNHVILRFGLKEGKYVLVKDPSKPQVRIYDVPQDAFDNDYVEEPLPEEEQVQPPAEDADGVDANATINDVEDKDVSKEAA